MVSGHMGPLGTVNRQTRLKTLLSHQLCRYLIKRAQGRRKFGLKNFKRRYFCLTNHSLIYAKGKGKGPTYSPFSIRVRLYWGESDIASRWIHTELLATADIALNGYSTNYMHR